MAVGFLHLSCHSSRNTANVVALLAQESCSFRKLQIDRPSHVASLGLRGTSPPEHWSPSKKFAQYCEFFIQNMQEILSQKCRIFVPCGCITTGWPKSGDPNVRAYSSEICRPLELTLGKHNYATVNHARI